MKSPVFDSLCTFRLPGLIFRALSECKIWIHCTILLALLLTQTNTTLAQSPILFNDFNENVNPEENIWADWTIRNDINNTHNFAWVRSDAQSYLSTPTDLRPRMFAKSSRTSSNRKSEAQITMNERAPGTVSGGSLNVFADTSSSGNKATWWIWYGGRPISQDIPGIDADTDRISMYAKFENIDDYQEVHFATYLSNGGPKEHDNSHFYHHLHVPSGTWLHILIDRHPSHRRSHDGQRSPRNNPGLDLFGLDYMPSLLQIYFEIQRDSSSAQTAQYYLDELYFYSTKDTPEPDQNDDSISSAWVGYWADESRWEIGFEDESYYYDAGQSRDDTTWATYEVRWSLSPITNENWDQATPIQNTTYNDGLAAGQFRRTSSWRAAARTSFDIPNLPEGISRVYFAIKDISAIGEHVGGNAKNGDGRDSLSPYIHTIDYILAAVTPVPPVARAGPDQTVFNNSLAILNGSASYDPNNDPLTYLWQQTSGTTVVLSDATLPNPSFIAPADTNLSFELTVTANNESASDLVNITSTPAPPPVAVTGPDRTVSNGFLVSLDGSESYHPNGGQLTYLWEQLSGPDVTLSDVNAPNPSFIAPANETISFKLTVTVYGESATDIITITSKEVPPLSTAGLVHTWLFEEDSGDTVIDDIDPAFNGTLAATPATPTRTTGKVGNALSFDGSDDRVDIPPLNLIGNAFTFSLWMNLDSQKFSDARLFSKATGASNNDHIFMLSTHPDRSLRFRLKTEGNDTLALIGSKNSFELNTWHHIIAIYDGSVLRILVDGTEVASEAITGEVTQSNTPFALGNQPAGAGTRPLDGMLDQIRIYNRALTTEEINALRNEKFITTAPVLNFATWLAGYDSSLTGDNALPDADPNQNGVSNLLEYAFDFPSPTSSHTSEMLPQRGISEDGLWATFEWRQIKGASDLIYTVEYSYNLSSWKSVNDPNHGINFIETVLDEDIDGDNSARLNRTRLKIDPENSFFYRLNVKLNNNG